jgi:cell division septum initiation protein DivIVA
MEPTPFEKKTWDVQEKLLKAYQDEVEKNRMLQQEIKYLRAQLEEKEARLMEAKCGTK